MSVTTVTLTIDAAANRHAINPLIYGVAFASETQLTELNAPLNRQGGNAASRYNWEQNASNRAADWYFESIAETSAAPGESADTFVDRARAAGAQPIVTIPMLPWVARLGANRGKRASFSIAKYGAQTGNDSQWFPDAGNGIWTSGGRVVGNDPADANVFVNTSFQQAWVQHIVGRLGGANGGGLRYYALDNEPSLWHETHRDVHPAGATMDEVRQRLIDYSQAIKAIDPGVVTIGPEEWGWSGYLFSGYDQQWGNTHGWTGLPDRAAHGGWDYLPWLLDQLRTYNNATGARVLDIVSVHYYPQGGEFSSSTTSTMQLRRNRSTRSLWDPNYVDETWINDRVQLIPRLRNWVASYYGAGTPIAITEYNWGAEPHISGAIAQADVLGIFGREGLDMAARWTTPDPSTPTFKAMKLYRNYDGNRSTFGDVSVKATGGNPDNVAVFAATRTNDGALTVMVLNKYLSGTTPVTLNLAGFQHNGTATVWQLTSANTISALGVQQFTGNSLVASLPQQSVTLFVFPAGTSQPPDPNAIAAPSGLTGTPSKTGVTLKWADNSTNETGFYVERLASTQTWTRIATTGPGTTAFFDAIGRGTYDYRVQAFNATTGRTSDYSNRIQVRVK